jgi:hypothetical protein
MAHAFSSPVPPPVVCPKCGSAWPRLWVIGREIERCPYCHDDLRVQVAGDVRAKAAELRSLPHRRGR